MSEVPDKKNGEKKGDGFDVVLVHGKTADGEGASVLRARPGRIEAGEVRPLREGRPLARGGVVVRLAPRAGTPHIYDVDVQYEVPKPAASDAGGGPAQVATHAYRESWERTFGRRRNELAN